MQKAGRQEIRQRKTEANQIPHLKTYRFTTNVLSLKPKKRKGRVSGKYHMKLSGILLGIKGIK